MKSTLKIVGEILTLIGAILTTIYSSFFLLSTFWMIIPIFWFAAVITFTWVIRYQGVTNHSRNWIIFGIVLSTFGNFVGLAGYICLLIKDIQDEVKPDEATPQAKNTDDSAEQQNPFTQEKSEQ
ncbi:hypothetical protein R2F61_08860 [Mollicutes bacterium LVI A0078]|nr:hypothetical protein RZE84_08635 [Mollicutes bacterium LVI A0075]WOO90810.1 hypothetical protein R2F61_08860 [Mollicutes bacterium LVI A0078]